jgi:hypothetical protein
MKEGTADNLQSLGKGCMGIGCTIPLLIILGSFLVVVVGGLLGSL